MASFLQQLWNKGIDITASVLAATLSAGIVAGIGTLAWRWNKRRDLKHEEEKQRQQHRVAEELERASRDREIQETRDRAQRVIQGFVNATATEEPSELAVRFFKWLRQEKLVELNSHIMSQERALTLGPRPELTSPAVTDARRESLKRVIQSTNLPKVPS